MSDEERKENMMQLAEDIQNSGLNFPDIRKREWGKLDDVPAAKLLQLLIEAEDIFLELDDFQMSHEQCYPEIEEMMLQIGVLREQYTNFVDSHIEVLDIKQK